MPVWLCLACVQVSGSKRLVSRMAAPEPNPACMVCGRAQAHLAVNTQAMTLQQLVTKASPAPLSTAKAAACGQTFVG